MAELARGTIADRPWGKTVGALGMRGLTGQLTVSAEGKKYCIAFNHGAIVGASSPLASDAGVRVALTGHLVSSTQIAEITRRLAQFPDRDEVSVIAEQARLTSEQAQKLRRRLVAQRAARTFSVERGEFTVSDTVTVPVIPGNELDIRAVIYLGARTNLSEGRLGSELTQVGGWFKTKPEAFDDLSQFGFSELETPVLSMLATGASLLDLQAAHAELTTHTVNAVIYALMSCNACDVKPAPEGRGSNASNPPASRTQTPVNLGRAQTPSISPMSRSQSGIASGRAHTPSQAHQRLTPPRGYATGAPTELRRFPTAPIDDSPSTRASDPGSSSPSLPRATTNNDRPIMTRGGTDPGGSGSGIRSSGTVPPAMARTSPPDQIAQSRTGSRPGIPGRAHTPSTGAPRLDAELVRPRPPSGPPATTPAGAVRTKRNESAAKETEALIAERVALLDQGVDHFTLLAVGREASPEEIRNSYFNLARKLHPDRLASIGVADDKRDAQRLFAQINTAFAMLSNPVHRADYLNVLGRGGEAAIKAEEAKIEDLTIRVMRAEEAFRRGEMALRRDQLTQAIADFQEASELQPGEPEYQALLAWAKFAAAPDKVALASVTRAALIKADGDGTRSVAARFYLGRVERMLGREREALSHFQEVLRTKPNHAEASSEVRVLEARLKAKR